jgi:hypothetical protein
MLIQSASKFVRDIAAAAICAAALLTCHTPAAAAPIVWSGLKYEFTRPDLADPNPADMLTPSVALARNDDKGLYNSIVDAGWNGSGPAGTRWATGYNNPGKTITAANWADLDYADWAAAYGGSSNLVTEIILQAAVVHLVDEDIYLDLQFTDWTARFGGGFSYLRAEPPPIPEPTTFVLAVSAVALILGRRGR